TLSLHDALPIFEFKQRVAVDRQTAPLDMRQRPVACAERVIWQREDRRATPIARRRPSAAGALRAVNPFVGGFPTVLATHTRRSQVTPPHYKFEARAPSDTSALRATEHRDNGLGPMISAAKGGARPHVALRPRGSPQPSSGPRPARSKERRARCAQPQPRPRVCRWSTVFSR